MVSQTALQAWSTVSSDPRSVSWLMFIIEQGVASALHLGAVLSAIRSRACATSDAACTTASFLMDMATPASTDLDQDTSALLDSALQAILGALAVSVLVLGTLHMLMAT